MFFAFSPELERLSNSSTSSSSKRFSYGIHSTWLHGVLSVADRDGGFVIIWNSTKASMRERCFSYKNT
jgi:hypothetical protein